MVQRFHSKQDWWLTVLIWGTLLGAAIVLFVVTSDDIPSPALRLLLGLGPIALTLLLIFPLYYEVGDGQVLVRCGFVRYRIPGDSIVSIVPSRNPVRSPALSLDRLAIRYTKNGGRRLLLVSPEEKDGFLAAVSMITPHLRVTEQELVPR